MGDMVILSPEEYFLWNEFVLGNSFPESFLQSAFWSAERFFVVVEKDEEGNIVQGAKVEERGLWMGKTVWLVRRSVNSQQGAVNRIAEYLIEKAKEQGNVVMIRFQSLFPERSKAESKEYINETLRQAQRVTTCPPKFLVHIEDPKTTLMVDLKFSEEELLREMHEKTRYNIHLAERKGVVVREGDFKEFYRLYKETNRRKGLKGFSREYFEKLLLARHPKLDLPALPDPSRGRGSRNKKLKQTELSSRSFIRDPNNKNQKEKDIVISSGGVAEVEKSHPAHDEPMMRSLRNGRDDVKVMIFTAYHNNIPLVSNLLVCFGKTVTYLFGGSSDQYRELMAPHLLHWECIKWAKQNGFGWYDWWGIESQSTGGSQQLTKMHGLRNWEGITRFKKGFVSGKTGKVVEFAETKDVIVREGWYRIFSFMKKLLAIL